MVEFEDLNHPGCERTMRVEPSETERLYDLVMSGTDEDGKSWSTKARPIATGVEDSDSDDEGDPDESEGEEDYDEEDEDEEG